MILIDALCYRLYGRQTFKAGYILKEGIYMLAAIKFLVALMATLVVFGTTVCLIYWKKDSTVLRDIIYWVFIILAFVVSANLVLIFIKYIIY